jgi:hypothetical protein
MTHPIIIITSKYPNITLWTYWYIMSTLSTASSLPFGTWSLKNISTRQSLILANPRFRIGASSHTDSWSFESYPISAIPLEKIVSESVIFLCSDSPNCSIIASYSIYEMISKTSECKRRDRKIITKLLSWWYYLLSTN